MNTQKLPKSVWTRYRFKSHIYELDFWFSIKLSNSYRKSKRNLYFLTFKVTSWNKGDLDWLERFMMKNFVFPQF